MKKDPQERGIVQLWLAIVTLFTAAAALLLIFAAFVITLW